MANTPFIGEIRLCSYQFAPRGWAFCNGQLLAIVQNQALFSILGTTYGGDGRTTFGLPNMQGRVGMHAGTGPGLSPRVLGESAGAENVTLLATQLPAHTHALVGRNGPGTSTSPSGNLWGTSAAGVKNFSATPTQLAPMSSAAVLSTGGNQPHNNMQPVLVMNYIIALTGIFPSRP